MPAAAPLADLPPRTDDPLRRALADAYHQDETAAVEALLAELRQDAAARERVQARARRLAERLRAETAGAGGVEAFMHAYSLDTHEGVMLMCLAEALLRVPDAETQDRLIRDKIGDVDWLRRVGGSESFLINASAFGLMLSGRVVGWDRPGEEVTTRLGRLVSRLGEPVVREAMRQAMRVMGQQFVLGQTIEQAIDRARQTEAQGFRYSYDMLGEGARTAVDADRYLASYTASLERIAEAAGPGGLHDRPSLSIKLSALHPRYEHAKWRRLEAELLPRVVGLARTAKARGVQLTVDAEESDRLEPSLDLFAALARHPDLAGWHGLGLAVQAYQKRAVHVVAWLADLARDAARRIPVRLVKGAYWDGEVKRAQGLGVADYPVFTRKVATDVAYLACAKRLLDGGDLFYPAFATHNAQTIAAVVELAGNRRDFEFQKLHGMGDTLYRDLRGAERVDVPCRVYAPVGSHKDLLPYLVRRLLENGANSSFVHQVVDPETSLDDLVSDPVRRLTRLEPKPHPALRRPPDLFAPQRPNAPGLDLSHPQELADLKRRLDEAAGRQYAARPGVDGADRLARQPVRDPSDRRRTLGEVAFADTATAERALAKAHAGFAGWARVPAPERAAILDRAAGFLAGDAGRLLYLCCREGGRTLADSVADWREAIDFLRYYAAEARRLLAGPTPLPGPTGEENRLELHPRGVFVCISPWNFPLAIFTGQLAAALAAGNAVVAKPAEATSLTAAAVVDLLHRAGVPGDALVLLPGEGGTVGPVLVADPRTAGVAFTGGTDTARAINRAMAATDLPIRPLIAETGGLNAMIVDSSALPEQVVTDAVESAFRSAGQRCSALRVLFLQDEVAPRILEMLTGAMDELEIGDPAQLATDVGPVIDEPARDELLAHVERMRGGAGRILHQCSLSELHAHGSFVPPTLVEIDRMARLAKEPFGPVLHVVRYRGERLDAAVDEINAAGYGLTFGVHSRIDATIDRVTRRIRAGNVYVNRNIIGAVVGSQPFGGEGLSGTGPKAGGPSYLPRFCAERTITVNTAAVGGNLALLGALQDRG